VIGDGPVLDPQLDETAIANGAERPQDGCGVVPEIDDDLRPPTQVDVDGSVDDRPWF
jgi:hypothetical protein